MTHPATTQDPVHKDPESENDWYFWDETWVDKVGPFNSETEARTALDKYVKEYLE